MNGQHLKRSFRILTAILIMLALIGQAHSPLPTYASGPTLPPGATLGTVVAIGTIPGTSPGGVPITGLTPGNWYAIESSGGPVNVLFGTGPNTCTIAIRDSAGGPWYSRDSWTTSAWVSQHDNLGPCATETNPWYSYSRFWFVANSTGVSVRVYDGAWVDNTGSLDFTLYAVNLADTVAPTTTAYVSCTLGLNGWCHDTATITLSAVDSGSPASGVQATYFDSSPYTTPIVVTAEGFTNFTYYSTDSAGNVEATQTGSVQIDTQPPLTTCTPSGTIGSNGWYTAAVTYTCAAADPTSGLATITFDSVPYWSPVTISTAGLSTHTFFATDNAGNVEGEQSTAVRIDSDLPIGSLTSPSAGQTVSGLITVTGTATDSTSGIARVEVSTDGGVTWHVASYGDPTWSFDWDTTGWPDGDHSLEARATDLAGNQQVFSTINLTVAHAPPTAIIQLTCPQTGDAGWCRAPLSVGLFGNPGGSPITRLDYERDGQLLTVDGDHLVYEENANGEHHVRVKVMDSLGRQSTPIAQTFKIDHSVPWAQFNGYANNSLDLTVGDEGSGVTRWMAQVFDGQGQSVFYTEGVQPLAGELSWLAAPGIYQVEIFVRDAAGNEAHLPRTAFAVSAPSPALVFEQVLGIVAPTIMPTPQPDTPTVQPARPTPTSVPPTTTLAPPTATVLPAVATIAPTHTIVLASPSVEQIGPVQQTRSLIGLLSLAALLGLLSIWALSSALDRRPSALYALADELKSLQHSGAQGGIRL